MPFNPDIHHRRSIRLRDYDYSSAGAYFVTICTWQRECLFGEIVNGEMQLNAMGNAADTVWLALPEHYTGLQLDEYIIMPNRFHGIISIVGAGFKPAPVYDDNATRAGFKPAHCSKPDQLTDMQCKAGLKPAPTGKQHGLSEIVRGFKTFSGRQINIIRNNPGCPVWQRNYYERVLRNDEELTRAREYIVNNPLKWVLDKENPVNMN